MQSLPCFSHNMNNVQPAKWVAVLWRWYPSISCSKLWQLLVSTDSLSDCWWQSPKESIHSSRHKWCFLFFMFFNSILQKPSAGGVRTTNSGVDRQLVMHILSWASANDLMGAQNEAFMALSLEFFLLQGQVNTQRYVLWLVHGYVYVLIWLAM